MASALYDDALAALLGQLIPEAMAWEQQQENNRKHFGDATAEDMLVTDVGVDLATIKHGAFTDPVFDTAALPTVAVAPQPQQPVEDAAPEIVVTMPRQEVIPTTQYAFTYTTIEVSDSAKVSAAQTNMRSAHSQLRNEGSLPANIEYVLGPDIVSTTEASVPALLNQAAVAYTMVAQGAVADPIPHAAVPNVVQYYVGDVTTALRERPGQFWIWAPADIPRQALSAMVSLLLDTGPSGYDWRIPGHPNGNAAMPVGARYNYPSLQHEVINLVFETRTEAARALPLGGDTLTLDALDKLLSFWRKRCGGPAVRDSLIFASHACHAYVEPEPGDPDGLGPGLTAKVTRANAKLRNMVGNERTDDDGDPDDDFDFGHLSGQNAGRAVPGAPPPPPGGGRWAGLPGLEEPVTAVQIARDLLRYVEGSQADVLAATVVVDEGGIQFTAAEPRGPQGRPAGRGGGRPPPGRVQRDHMATFAEMQAWLDGGVPGVPGPGAERERVRRQLGWFLRRYGPPPYARAVHAYPPVAFDGGTLDGSYSVMRNVWGQREDRNPDNPAIAVVAMPALRYDAVWAVFAGIKRLASSATTSRIVTNWQQATFAGVSLIHAARAHWLMNRGLYAKAISPAIMAERTVPGAVSMQWMPQLWRGTFMPADWDEVSYPWTNLECLEAGTLFPAGRMTPFIGYRVEGKWPSTLATSVEVQRLRFVPALDAAFRYTLQDGGTVDIGLPRGMHLHAVRAAQSNTWTAFVLPDYVIRNGRRTPITVRSDQRSYLDVGSTDGLPNLNAS